MFEAYRRALDQHDLQKQNLAWRGRLPDEREGIQPEPDYSGQRLWFSAVSSLRGNKPPSTVLVEEVVFKQKTDTATSTMKFDKGAEKHKKSAKSQEKVQKKDTGTVQIKLKKHVCKFVSEIMKAKAELAATHQDKDDQYIKEMSALTKEEHTILGRKSQEKSKSSTKVSKVSDSAMKLCGISTYLSHIKEKSLTSNAVKEPQKVYCQSHVEIRKPDGKPTRSPQQTRANQKSEETKESSASLSKAGVTRRMELSTEGFWDFLFSNRWPESKCLLRVLQGELLDSLLEALYYLEKELEVISYVTVAYFQTDRPTREASRKRLVPREEEDLEQVLVEFDCFSPKRLSPRTSYQTTTNLYPSTSHQEQPTVEESVRIPAAYSDSASGALSGEPTTETMEASSARYSRFTPSYLVLDRQTPNSESALLTVEVKQTAGSMPLPVPHNQRDSGIDAATAQIHKPSVEHLLLVPAAVSTRQRSIRPEATPKRKPPRCPTIVRPGQALPGQPAPEQSVLGQPIQGHPIPGQPVQGQPIQGQPSQGHPIPGQPIQGQPLHGQPIQRHPIPGQPIQGHPIPGQPMQGHPIPGQPIQGQPIQGQPIQGHPIPGQPIQGQPIQGRPIQGQPIQGQPMQGQPIQRQPTQRQTIQGQPIQRHPKPGEPIQGQPIPGQSIHGQTMQGQSMQGRPMRGQPIQGQSIQGQPIPGQPIPGQPIKEQPMQGQPMQGQPIPGQPIQGQSIQGQPILAQPIHGKCMQGQLIQGQPIQGQPIPGQPIPGQLIQGQPIQGQPIPGQPVQGQPIQMQPITGQSIQGQPIQGQPAQVQPITGQPIQGQSIPGQTIHWQPIQGQTIHGQSIQGQPVQVQPIQGQPVQGQPTQGLTIPGQLIHGNPMQEQPIAGQPVQGQLIPDHLIPVQSIQRQSIPRQPSGTTDRAEQLFLQVLPGQVIDTMVATISAKVSAPADIRPFQPTATAARVSDQPASAADDTAQQSAVSQQWIPSCFTLQGLRSSEDDTKRNQCVVTPVRHSASASTAPKLDPASTTLSAQPVMVVPGDSAVPGACTELLMAADLPPTTDVTTGMSTEEYDKEIINEIENALIC